VRNFEKFALAPVCRERLSVLKLTTSPGKKFHYLTTRCADCSLSASRFSILHFLHDTYADCKRRLCPYVANKWKNASAISLDPNKHHDDDNDDDDDVLWRGLIPNWSQFADRPYLLAWLPYVPARPFRVRCLLCGSFARWVLLSASPVMYAT